MYGGTMAFRKVVGRKKKKPTSDLYSCSFHESIVCQIISIVALRTERAGSSSLGDVSLQMGHNTFEHRQQMTD
jgi:hypothetical protein